MWKYLLTFALILAVSACSPNRFETLDYNSDQYLGEDEVATGFFSEWDTNDDDMLSENEWGVGVNEFGVWDNNEFGVWDDDASGFLDENEFGAGFGESGVFDEWDLDDNNRLGVNEYNEIGLP